MLPPTSSEAFDSGGTIKAGIPLNSKPERQAKAWEEKMRLRVGIAVIALLFAFSLVIRPNSPAAQVRQGGPKVEVYMTTWCGYCKKTLSYLDEKGVSYAAYDIESDSAAKERYLALGGQGVPLVVIDGNKIAGYSPQAMDRYLQASQ